MSKGKECPKCKTLVTKLQKYSVIAAPNDCAEAVGEQLSEHDSLVEDIAAYRKKYVNNDALLSKESGLLTYELGTLEAELQVLNSTIDVLQARREALRVENDRLKKQTQLK
jgi:hypothetical protein